MMNHEEVPPRPNTTALLEPVDDAPATTAAGAASSGDLADRGLKAELVIRCNRRAHPSVTIGRDRRAQRQGRAEWWGRASIVGRESRRIGSVRPSPRLSDDPEIALLAEADPGGAPGTPARPAHGR